MQGRTSIFAAVLLLTGCGGDGSSPAPAPPVSMPPVQTAPSITSFSASPQTVAAGQNTTLNWAVTGASTITISPGIGTVTANSVAVAPSATTTYTLTATNAAGSVTATTTVTVGAFAADDQRLGDPSISYTAIEVSPDMRFMTWVEEAATPGGASSAWLCALDPVTGRMVPENGRGFKIANIRLSGQPQWGRDAEGGYSLVVDTAGRLVMARPTLSGTQTVSANLTVLPTPANSTRKFPYGSRIAGAGGYIVYHQDDPLVAGRQQLWWLNLAAPTVENQITSGPVASIGQNNLPPFIVNIQRWFYDVTPGASGPPVVIYGDATPNPSGIQPLTVEQLDFGSGQAVPSRIVGVSQQLLDPFPFISANERYIIGGISAGPIGAVYRRDANGQYTVPVNQIETTGSTLSTPSNFASAEPFLYNGKIYTAYQLNEPGFPGSTNGEMWFTSVFDNSLRRRISAPGASRRADPEFFIGTSKVWILYYGRQNETQNWELRRADTGL